LLFNQCFITLNMNDHIETINTALRWRYATKQFIGGKRVPEEIRNTILEAGRMAPTAYGLQPFRVVHVTSPEIRRQLREASYGQAQVTDAGDFFIIAHRTDINTAFVDAYVARISATRGVAITDLQGFGDTMKGDICARTPEDQRAWAMRQAYIGLGMMLETAALLNVDACPMEGFNASAVDELLNLSEKHLASVGYMALGYRTESDTYATLQKVRLTADEFVVSIG
jgi:nitroreductase